MVERDLNTGLLILETEPGGWSVCLDLYLSSSRAPAPWVQVRFLQPLLSLHLQAQVGSLGEEVRAEASFQGQVPLDQDEGVPLQASAARCRVLGHWIPKLGVPWGRLPGVLRKKAFNLVSVLKSFDCLSTPRPSAFQLHTQHGNTQKKTPTEL